MYLRREKEPDAEPGQIGQAGQDAAFQFRRDAAFCVNGIDGANLHQVAESDCTQSDLRPDSDQVVPQLDFTGIDSGEKPGLCRTHSTKRGDCSCRCR